MLLYYHKAFAPLLTLDAQLLDDDFAEQIDFIVRQIAHPRIGTNVRSIQQLLAGRKPDRINVGEPDLDPLFAGKVKTSNSVAGLSSLSYTMIATPLHCARVRWCSLEQVYPCPWLCRALVQMTRTMPFRRMTRQLSHRFDTAADTFISAISSVHDCADAIAITV